MSKVTKLNAGARARLAAKRIFFGHQSVGDNIIDGLTEIAGMQGGTALNVVTLEEANSLSGGFLAHSHVGRNRYPETKTDAFAKLIDDGLGETVDIAFHKYCFADIDENTEVERIFEHYKQTMARLKVQYPLVGFAHVTIPLMAVQSGPKALLKKLLGRAPARYEPNFRREEYNELMRREYRGREPLFDLAALEATNPEGNEVTISFGERSGRTLYEPFTSDGGHLNEAGRRYVAENLVVFLAQLEQLVLEEPRRPGQPCAGATGEASPAPSDGRSR